MIPGWQELLIILVIVAIIFGTKKIRSIGSDLGGAVKGFKDSVSSNVSNTETNDVTSCFSFKKSIYGIPHK